MRSADYRTLPRGIRDYLSLQDFIDHARKVLRRPIYGYVTGGVEDGMSLRGNRVIRLLIDEIDRDMAMLGINTLKEMSNEFLMPATGAGFLQNRLIAQSSP